MKREIINKANWHLLFRYFSKGKSLFRNNQIEFLKRISREIEGDIIEIGAEDQYKHADLFRDGAYFATNVNRSGISFLDVTNIQKESNSVDNYLCVSVLEHVKEIIKAINEITRTLKPGGNLFLIIPFGYPVHDVKDYWRLAPDSYLELFTEFDIQKFYHLGGKLSTCADALRRPVGKISLRYFIYKSIGWFCFLLAIFLDRVDDFPTGYALCLKKK
jgi:SAM-dependent methyltransferase